MILLMKKELPRLHTHTNMCMYYIYIYIDRQNMQTPQTQGTWVCMWEWFELDNSDDEENGEEDEEAVMSNIIT